MEIANLVKKHDFFAIDNLNTWEEKIMYYADKRVDGDNVVSLKKRFKEGNKLKRALCDMFSLGYHVENSIIIDNLIRRLER